MERTRTKGTDLREENGGEMKGSDGMEREKTN